MKVPAGWITPDWPAPVNVRSICTTRAGGISHPPYGTLNLGDHVGDAPEAVTTNRKILAGVIQARPVFLRQVHGRSAVVLDSGAPDGAQADGCVATAPGVACTMMVADCLPVLFCTADGGVVAAAHAGWRGLAGEGGQGILEAVVGLLGSTASAQPAQMLAWLGPCIGAPAFEVGSEVRAAFEADDAGAASLFRPHAQSKWLADLQGLARRRLHALGIARIYGNDGGPAWCTVANPSQFFSHRRDRVGGRFAASIWRA